MAEEVLFTKVVRERVDEIKSILESSVMNLPEKVSRLRSIAREIAHKYFEYMPYKSLDEFYNDYDRKNSPLSKLEGPGMRYGDLIILKNCPSVALFEYFRNEDGSFPEYWKSLPEEFMKQFQNEAILHPLCIVHQAFRDILASHIPKGSGVVHSIAVACRSVSTGKIVYSNFGLRMANRTQRDVEKKIEGFACAFLVR